MKKEKRALSLHRHAEISSKLKEIWVFFDDLGDELIQVYGPGNSTAKAAISLGVDVRIELRARLDHLFCQEHVDAYCDSFYFKNAAPNYVVAQDTSEDGQLSPDAKESIPTG